MKDIIVLELPVSSDLTETALHRAVEMIIDYNIKNGHLGVYKHYILRVASQNMGIAPFMGSYIGAGFKISPTYEPDEWSLSEICYDKNDTYTITVHSEGA